jgi:hypothetical protein
LVRTIVDRATAARDDARVLVVLVLLAVAVLVVLAVGVLVRVRPAHRPVPAGSHAGDDGLDPGDVADLDARLVAIADEEHQQRDARLQPALDRLIERQVPLRAVEAATGVGCARVRFADGTALLVRGDPRGSAGVLAGWVRQGSVVLAAYGPASVGVELTVLDRAHARRLRLLATGLDQPD